MSDNAWIECAGDWSVVMQQPGRLLATAVRAGMTGRKEPLRQLLEALAQGGLELPAQEAGGEVRLKVSDGLTTSPTVARLGKIDVQMAVAMAFAFDEPLLGDDPLRWGISTQLASKMAWERTDASIVRSAWNAQDDALLAAAIEVYRPGGILAADDRSDKLLARLMALVSRYVDHAGAVQVFARQHVEVGALARWCVSPTDPFKLAFEPAWEPRYTPADPLPLPVMMLRHGHARAAAAMLSYCDAAQAGSLARHVLTDVLENDRLQTLKEPRIGQAPRSHGEAWEASFGLLDQLGRLCPGLTSRGARLALAEALIDNVRRPPDELVQWVMSHRDASDATTLEELLSQAPGLPAPGDEPGDMDRWQHDNALKALVLRAVEHHQPGILEAARPVLQHMVSQVDGDGWSFHDRGVVCAGQLHESFEFRAREFERTLEILRDCGFRLESLVHTNEVRQRKDGTVLDRTTGLLHLLAASGNKARIDAMVTALAFAPDVRLKDSSGMRPDMVIKNPEAKRHWLEVARSHLARQSALCALDEIPSPRPAAGGVA